MEIKKIAIEKLKPASYNPRKDLKPDDIEYQRIKKSIDSFGYVEPIVWNKKTGNVVGGHQRLKILKEKGLKEVDVVVVDVDEITEKSMNVALNKSVGEWENESLLELLEELKTEQVLEFTGFDENELKLLLEADKSVYDIYKDGVKGSLKEKYIMPPFSVLDTRQADWLNRKNEWKEIIGNEIDTREAILGAGKQGLASRVVRELNEGTSIFEPVLAEVMYEWFCTKQGTVLDCFAGGPVRGIVAGIKNLKYIGIELRQEQIDSNLKQIKKNKLEDKITYYCDDALNLDKHTEPESIDFLFTCPPYYDLEVYSKDKKDLSNLSDLDFEGKFKEIVAKASVTLKKGCYACVVISEIRGKDGYFRGFVPKTISYFEDVGLKFYNEIILINAIGTLPLRIEKQFKIGRKVGRMHQNILVFKKV